MSSSPAIVVFSHLRWGFVYQRPQHLMSRLARHRRVLFIEEPVHSDGPPRIDCHSPCDGVTVLVPRTPVRAGGFHDDQLAVLEPLLAADLQRRGVHEAIVWLYTPMALPLVKTLQAVCLVYDCMDELSAFKDAPRQLRQRETALLKRADVVFAGGPSLYEAKRGLHDNLHCVPSSVDAGHYAPTRLEAGHAQQREAERLQGDLARPRLGYFGVIDERLDLSLVAHIADSHPDWQVVMVGPLAKIDPQSTPQRQNIRWLGMQPYERLPYLLAGWDLCLMPFALNDSTRFISPTKTLEYMAGAKPVLSTSVNDVVLLYGDAVDIADGQTAFTRACERVLAESPAARSKREAAMRAAVSTHSWDRSADLMRRQIDATLLHRVALPQPLAAERTAAPLVAAAGARA